MKSTTLVCLFVAILGTPALGDETCDSIKKVMAAGSDLSQLRGDKISDGNWKLTANFPDFEECSIQTFKDALLLECKKPAASRAEMFKTINGIVDHMWTCPDTTSRGYNEFKQTDYGVSWTVFAGDAQFGLSGDHDMFSSDPAAYLVSMNVFEN